MIYGILQMDESVTLCRGDTMKDQRGKLTGMQEKTMRFYSYPAVFPSNGENAINIFRTGY